MVVSYDIVDKQCAWQQTDYQRVVMAHIVGGSRGWTTKLQCVYVWLLMVPEGIPAGGVGEVTDMI